MYKYTKILFFLGRVQAWFDPQKKKTAKNLFRKIVQRSSKMTKNHTLGAYSLPPVGGTGLILPWAKLGLVTLQPMGIVWANSKIDARDLLRFSETAC